MKPTISTPYAIAGAAIPLIPLIILALVLLAAKPAQSHDAIPTAAQPQGWSYPYSCCSGFDCRAVGDSQSSAKVRITERPEGYVISTTGEVIAYNDRRIKDSPDGDFHWCSRGGKDDGQTICLFVPPRAF